jgi:general secretion pathway protein L
MVNEFLVWWLQRLAELVSERLSRRLAAPSQALLVDVEEEFGQPLAFALTVRRGRQHGRLGRFRLDPAGLRAARAVLPRQRRLRAVILRLPGSALLEREVAVPLAAERDPAGVLRYDMDRLTPFAADEVFWTWAVERRDEIRGNLHLRLSLVPKARVQPVLAALGAIGLAATEIQPAAPDDHVMPRIALIPAASARGRWRQRAAAVAAIGCAGLTLAAIVTPFATQAVQRAAVERRITAMAPTVQLAEALRKRIASANASRDVLAAERARLGDPLVALAALTDLLPDDTYVSDFSLNARKLSFAGRSGGAARLIGLLSASPIVRNPVFGAPVTRTEDGQSLFSIRADLGG